MVVPICVSVGDGVYRSPNRRDVRRVNSLVRRRGRSSFVAKSTAAISCESV